MTKLKTHCAIRIVRSVRHIGETVWQPLCNKGNTSNIRMSTVLEEVDCLDCRNQLWAKRFQLGVGRQLNRIRREGKWA